MLYALKIATRYLLSSKAQSALLVLGVALGVFIFIFMSALIGGLANYILDSIAGDLSHVSITAEDEAFIESLVPTGEHSGRGFQDTAYPITGRRFVAR